MTALAVTYLIVWLSVVLYVARLRVHQSRLRKQIEALSAQVSANDSRDPLARAA